MENAIGNLLKYVLAEIPKRGRKCLKVNHHIYIYRWYNKVYNKIYIIYDI